jgi:hypothetical protein
MEFFGFNKRSALNEKVFLFVEMQNLDFMIFLDLYDRFRGIFR